MNNERKPRFEINIDDSDYENGFDYSDDSASGHKDLVVDSSFLDKYGHYETEEKENKPVKRAAAPKKKKGDGGFVVRILIAVAVVFVSVWLATICFSAADDVLGMMKKDGIIIVEIHEGATISEIGDILKDKGCIGKVYASRVVGISRDTVNGHVPSCDLLQHNRHVRQVDVSVSIGIPVYYHLKTCGIGRYRTSRRNVNISRNDLPCRILYTYGTFEFTCESIGCDGTAGTEHRTAIL